MPGSGPANLVAAGQGSALLPGPAPLLMDGVVAEVLAEPKLVQRSEALMLRAPTSRCRPSWRCCGEWRPGASARTALRAARRVQWRRPRPAVIDDQSGQWAHPRPEPK